MLTLFYSLFFGAVASLANFLGGVIIVKSNWDRGYLKYFLAFGAGFMLATAFLEMVPRSMELLPSAPGWILAGYLLVHLFEHSFAPHFHFGEEIHKEELLDPRVGFSALVGLLSHTFFDGVAIASGFIISYRLGIILFIAIILHKLPEGFTVSSIMIASGKSKTSSLMAAAGLGVATMAGVLTMSAVQGMVKYGLPLSAGVGIYVAASDLMPEVNEEPGVKLAFSVFGGVFLFILTRALLVSL
ncbi:MAG: ZIP family metal transporter [Terriglobia bacterium]